MSVSPTLAPKKTLAIILLFLGIAAGSLEPAIGAHGSDVITEPGAGVSPKQGDSNGARDDRVLQNMPEDTSECSDTVCLEDDECSSCFLGYDPTNCDSIPLTCSEFMAHNCCAFGGADSGCGNNTALVTYVGCLAEEADCDVGDDFCEVSGAIGAVGLGVAAAAAVVGLACCLAFGV